MKNQVRIMIFLLLFAPGVSIANEFLGAPLIPKGKIIQKTGARLEMRTGLSHDAAVQFYRNALEGLADIKVREWKDATYIEDDGARGWHSITISKGEDTGTTIIIVKDSWTWIMGTLVLRYIGVFIVLLVLFLGMSASGYIISRSVKKEGAK